MFNCRYSSHYCFLTVNNVVCFRAKIRKLSFKRKRFLVKLHPEIFVSTYSIIYIILLTNTLFVYLMASVLAVMVIRKTFLTCVCFHVPSLRFLSQPNVSINMDTEKAIESVHGINRVSVLSGSCYLSQKDTFYLNKTSKYFNIQDIIALSNLTSLVFIKLSFYGLMSMETVKSCPFMDYSTTNRF